MQSIFNTQNFLAGRLVEEIKKAFSKEDVCRVDDEERFILLKFLLEYCCKIIQKGVWQVKVIMLELVAL